MLEVHGSCSARFERVRDAFIQNFEVDGEVGASFAVCEGDRMVVDLWAGWADEASARPWERDTLVNVFSIGKAVTSICLHHLVERGLVDLDAPVSTYWPEFARAGKDQVPVHAVLSHRAGLPAVRAPLPDEAVYSWPAMTEALAEQRPWWEPGTAHGYHVNTFGFLVGEVIRRVSGMSMGDYIRRHVSGPLGVEFHIGLPEACDEKVAAFLRYGSEVPAVLDASPTDDRILMIFNSYYNPAGLSGIGIVNTRRWRAAEVPSTNGHSNARSVARIFAGLANGELLDEQTLVRATSEHSSGPDLILGRPSRFGLGFQLSQAERPMGTSPRAFGHFGAGGSMGFADPDRGLGLGYTMNVMGPRWRNPNNRRLIDAVYSCLP